MAFRIGNKWQREQKCKWYYIGIRTMLKTLCWRNNSNKNHKNHEKGNKQFVCKMNTEQEMQGECSTNDHELEMPFGGI